MFGHRRRKQVPSLNTTSTADISFTLLILFLVTSSMDTDKGLRRQLPPPPQDHEEQMDVSREDVLQVGLDAQGLLTCDGELTTAGGLTQRVERFVEGRRESHILVLDVSREACYDDYFQMQDAIVRAYAQLRDRRARQVYGHGLRRCSALERQAVNAYYPQRISERIPEEGGAR